MSAFSEANLEVFPTAQALTHHVAEWMTRMARAKRGEFAVALSGGTTPRMLYRTLASYPFLGAFPWARAQWFWGDERFVPHDDPMSNYRMVCEAMLSRVPASASNIHAIATEGLTPADAARRYERALKNHYGAERLNPARPLFDLVLLGLGTDGHTASLFPGSPALDEREHWTSVGELKSQPRITLTYPAIESSAQTAFLVEGPAKRDILGRLRGGAADLPAARLRPNGALRIFADKAAAGT